MRRTFHILTFGCQMNVNDSQWLRRSLLLRGFTETPLEQAGVTVVNTCSVREKPELKVYSTLGRIQQCTGHNPDAFVVVMGCVAQQIGAAFFERFPQVRLVAGGDGLIGVPDAIARLCDDPAPRIPLLDFSPIYPERDAALTGERVPPTAYVNIMQGCDNFCAYCVVPYTRGRQKSRAAGDVLRECRALLEHGAREIILLGQNVNAFGQDACGDGTTFHQLLRQAATLPGLRRLRFVTPHPKDLSPEVIRDFAELETLCPRLHLPLQAGSDRVLARMGRKYDSARYLRMVRDLRAARPDMALSTDLIVGFPGETEEDFLATCRMVEAVDFVSSFSFCYSDRPGTRASRMPDKLPRDVKLERLARLQALQDRVGQAWLERRTGQETVVLLEGQSRKSAPAASGETSWQGQDPYGVTVNVALPATAGAAGDLLPVRIAAAKRHSLLGEAKGKPC